MEKIQYEKASRGLEAQLCSADRSLNTTYNGDKDVPSFTGMAAACEK